MADEKIVIDGEQYISSGRAAKLVGYTKDYVGQLARLGKIKATRVGRNWYINEASINKHKLSVHYTLTKPKKKKQTSTEKPIQNIDNSETVKRDIPATTAVADVHDTDAPDKELFPVPKKPKRDPLLHSEIRYENEETHHEAEKPVSRFKEEHVRTQKPATKSFSATNIQKQRIPRNNLLTIQKTTRPTNERIPNTAIDGIILQKKKSSPIHENINGVRNKLPFLSEEQVSRVDDYYEAPQELAEDDYADKLEYGDDSKMIPVIVAIIAFTLFVIVYILFFLD